jgi:hypothetical protein
MSAREQLIGASILAVATYFGVVRIAEGKCDAAVGSMGFRLDERQPEELASARKAAAQAGAAAP